jgi:hypothetical protein
MNRLAMTARFLSSRYFLQRTEERKKSSMLIFLLHLVQMQKCLLYFNFANEQFRNQFYEMNAVRRV